MHYTTADGYKMDLQMKYLGKVKSILAERDHKKYLITGPLLQLRIILFYFALFRFNPSNNSILRLKPKA